MNKVLISPACFKHVIVFFCSPELTLICVSFVFQWTAAYTKRQGPACMRSVSLLRAVRPAKPKSPVATISLQNVSTTSLEHLPDCFIISTPAPAVKLLPSRLDPHGRMGGGTVLFWDISVILLSSSIFIDLFRHLIEVDRSNFALVSVRSSLRDLFFHFTFIYSS